MRNFRQRPGVGVTAFLLGTSLLLCAPTETMAAQLPTPLTVPQLTINEINITGDEFVVLQNTGTAPVHLPDYWLGYVSDDSTTATPSQELPDETLAAGNAILLNNGAVASCGVTVVDDLAFSLANTSGTLALWHLAGSGQQASFALADDVSWGKAATGLNYLHIADEANLATQNLPNPTWYKASSAAGEVQKWQVGSLVDCAFTPVVAAAMTDENQTVSWQASSASPPFVVMAAEVVGNAKPTPSIPASDIGLKAVQLSEILPNPVSPQTDADNEFIELYNPNSATFDLTGFQLQYASTTSDTVHTYTFPAGTLIPGKTFQAFFAPSTHLSLSNSGGQVWLVDPLGNTLAQSAAYGVAKDGQAWILAGKTWQWTLQPTPGATNKLSAPAGIATTTTATVKGKKVTAVKAAATTATTSGSSTGAPQDVAQVTPVHSLTLVAVVAAAVLYGAYEYRTDLANRIYEYRKYRAARRIDRS